MADGSVIIDTKLDQTGLKTGLSKLGTDLVSGIKVAVEAAGAALAGLGTYATKVGSDFEYAISGVAATMGLTTDQIDVVSKKAKELGASTKFTATEAAEGFNILAMAGLSLDEQLTAIDATLALASAGEMNMDEAAGYLTTTVKAMSTSMREAGINMSDCAKIADMYAKGATLANTSTAQLGDAVSVAATVGGTYNQSLTSMTASLLALAEKGYQGSVAGTYLSRMMTDLYAPTEIAAKAMDKLGIAVYDEAGNQKDLLVVMDEVNAALADYTEEEKAAYTGQLFTTAGLKAFNSIAGNSNEQLMALKTSLEESTGSAQKMADVKLDNLQGDITILQSATEGFGIALYEAFTNTDDGSLNPLRGLVQEASDIMSEMTEVIKEGGLSSLTDVIGEYLARALNKILSYLPQATTAAINLVNSFVSGITQSIPSLMQSVFGSGAEIITGIGDILNNILVLIGETLISAANALSANSGNIIKSLTTVLTTVLKTIISYAPQILQSGISLIGSLGQSIIDAIPILLEALPELITAFIDGLLSTTELLVETVVTLVMAIAEALPGAIEQIVAMLPDIITQISNAIVELLPILIQAVIDIALAIAEAMPEIIQAVIDVLPTLIDTIISTVLTLIPLFIECALQLILAIAEALPDIITNIVYLIPSLIYTIIGAILDNLPEILNCILDIILAIVEYLPQIIYNIVECLPTLFTSIITGIVDCIPMLLECVLNLIIEIVENLPTFIVKIVEILPTLIASIVTGLIGCVGQLLKCAKDMIVSVVNVIPEYWNTLVAKLKELVITLSETIKNLWTKFKDAAKEWVEKIWSGVQEKWENLKKNVKELFQQLPDVIKEAFTTIKNVGKNLVEGLWNGINDAKDWVIGKIKGFGDAILGGIKSFFGIKSPSTVFRDIIGKNLVLGLADGIEQNADEAVDEMDDLAERLSEVPLKAGTVDYDGLVGNARSAVVANAITNSENAINGINETFRGQSDGQSEDSPEDKPKDRYIENNIYIDGRKTAKIITPFVSKELAWEGK